MLSWDVVKFSAVGIALAILIYAAVQYARIIHVEWCAWGPWYGWVVGLIGAALTLWGGLNWGIEPRTEISVRQYWLDNAFAALAALVGLATVGFMAWHFALMPQTLQKRHIALQGIHLLGARVGLWAMRVLAILGVLFLTSGRYMILLWRHPGGQEGR